MAKSTMKELEKVKHFIYSCRKCGVCRYKMTGKMPYVCPVKQASPGFETFSSRGKIILAQALLEGQHRAIRRTGKRCLQLHHVRQLHDPVRRHRPGHEQPSR